MNVERGQLGFVFLANISFMFVRSVRRASRVQSSTRLSCRVVKISAPYRALQVKDYPSIILFLIFVFRNPYCGSTAGLKRRTETTAPLQTKRTREQEPRSHRFASSTPWNMQDGRGTKAREGASVRSLSVSLLGYGYDTRA